MFPWATNCLAPKRANFNPEKRYRVTTQRMPLDGLRSLAAFASSMASAYKAGSIPALNLVQDSPKAVLVSSRLAAVPLGRTSTPRHAVRPLVGCGVAGINDSIII